MASTRDLADTLPFNSPDDGTTPVDSHHSDFAAYTLISLDQDGRQRFVNDLNTGDMTTKRCILATQPDFSGRTLRDIYDYHIDASKEDNTMHPQFFIVADQADWHTKGVLVVFLYVERDLNRYEDPDHDYESTVGVLRCGVDMADCICCNLDIANVSFVDYKEEEEQDWHGEDVYTNKRYFKYHYKTGELN